MVNHTEAKIRELFTEATKLERDVAYHHIEWAGHQLRDGDTAPPDWLVEKYDELVTPFEQLTRSLYLAIVCLLDSKKLLAYLKQFYAAFGEEFDSEKAAREMEFDHHWSGEPYNAFLSQIQQFLAPLGILDDDSRYLRLSGIKYLETILTNTALIVRKNGTSPKSEAEVYKAVRPVLEAIFPTARSAKCNFIKSAQEYKPDILIPELSAAIEYKYADSEARLKTTIAQIADDVCGYTGDPDYHLFYAVFYVKQDFWGPQKFREAWKEKGFPNNWFSFYVVGS